ncbi:hypothetical protein EUX98_g905 [Antrodiella citrinella]|uniref:Uncharacterized protein n=1 Tax=Antrodiella citrinella TaxID=2447956 RepID=A0A4S4N4D8_9APHY|nr:hypothetical protein EUX98_g905 [Antrodiella citrinella]
MEHETGDDYIRRIATHIRANEQGLAAAAYQRKRRTKATDNGSSILNPFAWFGGPEANGPSSSVKPVVLSFDTHHLFYLLMRMEALGIDVGSLDVKVDSPSRPMSYVNLFLGADKSDALSLMSFATSLSAVSRLSLGAGWWGRQPASVDVELKYIYSCFTKLPAISLHAPESRLIAELANESPNENALPFDAFKSIQSLECLDIDPRTLLGWDRLAESLWGLTVKRSGLEDVSDIFMSAVLDDQARREGKVNGTRPIRAPPSRQGSFYGTRLPDSVPEDAEDTPHTPTQEIPVSADSASHISSNSTAPSGTAPILPSHKWAFLRYLSLADNALTFLPTTPMQYLTSVTHLDLSSNLLVSVPSGLSALYNLVSLNLSDNMIDSVLGIYTMLGQVLHLNLARNRLESICGLERLRALERVDLRHNVVEESAEVGRLAALPNIVEVWIEGNPLVDYEEGYRIRCFDLFLKEGKTVLLDGSPPGFYEKRYLSSPPPEQMTSSRPVSTAYSPPAVAVSSPPRQAAPIVAASTSTDTVTAPSKESPNTSPPTSLPPSHTASPHISAVGARGRKKKNKRIVDLDGGSETGGSRSGSHSRVASNVASSAAARATSPGKASVLRPKELKAPAASTEPPAGASKPTTTVQDADVSSPPAPTAGPSSPRQKPKSRHGRHHTEYSPATNSRSDVDELLLSYPQDDIQSSGRRRSATMKSAARRARVSASVYEPPGAEKSGKDVGKQLDDAEAFRARIEALRSDMGDGWLKVFNQSHMNSAPAGVPS